MWIWILSGLGFSHNVIRWTDLESWAQQVKLEDWSGVQWDAQDPHKKLIALEVSLLSSILETEM